MFGRRWAAAAVAVRQSSTASVCSSFAATARSGGSSDTCTPTDVSMNAPSHASSHVTRARPGTSAVSLLAAPSRADFVDASSRFGLWDAAGGSLPETQAGVVLVPRAYVAYVTVRCPKELKASSKAVTAQKAEVD